MAIERFAYRPLRNAPRIAPLITALGVSFVLENCVLLLFGGFDPLLQQLPPSSRSPSRSTSTA